MWVESLGPESLYDFCRDSEQEESSFQYPDSPLRAFQQDSKEHEDEKSRTGDGKLMSASEEAMLAELLDGFLEPSSSVEQNAESGKEPKVSRSRENKSWNAEGVAQNWTETNRQENLSKKEVSEASDLSKSSRTHYTNDQSVDIDSNQSQDHKHINYDKDSEVQLPNIRTHDRSKQEASEGSSRTTSQEPSNRRQKNKAAVAANMSQEPSPRLKSDASKGAKSSNSESVVNENSTPTVKESSHTPRDRASKFKKKAGKTSSKKSRNKAEDRDDGPAFHPPPNNDEVS